MSWVKPPENTTFECCHCHSSFTPTPAQWTRKRDNPEHKAYCSKTCQDISRGLQCRKPLPFWQECPVCHQNFGSRTPRSFCGLKCYTKSDQFKAMLKNNYAKGALASAKLKKGETYSTSVQITCIQCSKQVWVKFGKRDRKYCSKTCYRAYMATRFDRWIANPQSIALPQGFDEFLNQTELPCLVEGCTWVGKALGNHVNFTHGIPVEEFKRAAGFNLSSGLVSSDMHDNLSARPHIHLPISERPYFQGMVGKPPGNISNYRSLEGAEHRNKTISLLRETVVMDDRVCLQCGETFTPKPLGWGTKYCSETCRSAFYYQVRKTENVVCTVCGKDFVGHEGQAERANQGLPVCCSFHCRQKRAGTIARHGVFPAPEKSKINP